MNPARSDIIVSGGVIAEELMHLLGIERVEISENGLREGMEIDYLISNGPTNFNVRESSVLNLANRCQYDRAHAETVRKNALVLFDRMKGAGIHNMDDGMRMLLSYACVLHDIGEFISYQRHHLHSYVIILNSYLRGFDNEELRLMALMARFHHGSFPPKDSKLFRDMDPDRVADLLKCAFMLKISDVLDRRRNSAVDSVGMSLSRGTATLSLRSRSDISMELWKLRTIRGDFKRVFGLDLEIETA